MHKSIFVLGICLVTPLTADVTPGYDGDRIMKLKSNRSTDAQLDGTTESNLSSTVKNITEIVQNTSQVASVKGSKIITNLTDELSKHFKNETSLKNRTQAIENTVNELVDQNRDVLKSIEDVVKSSTDKKNKDLLKNLTGMLYTTERTVLTDIGLTDPALVGLTYEANKLLRNVSTPASFNTLPGITHIDKMVGKTQTDLLMNSIKSLSNKTLSFVNRSDTTISGNRSRLNDTSFVELKNQADGILGNVSRGLPVSTHSLADLGHRTLDVLKKSNASQDLLKNLTRWVDTDAKPLWLFRSQVPWKHVSHGNTLNETEVVQVCKFEGKIAKCSAEFTDWNKKLWFQLAESPDRRGVNITVHEKSHAARVDFFNRVNDTQCQRFRNGTFHQICVKIYGYYTDTGPTRVCLELGAAIFNNGVASSDFGCFRFGSVLRKENPLYRESPDPAILNRYILGNNYDNYINESNPSSAVFHSPNSIFIYLSTVLSMHVLKVCSQF